MDNPRYNSVIVRYGEISLKGKNRIVFERKLRGDIVSFLKKENYEYSSVNLKRGRIYINGISKIPNLKKVFGIFSYSLAVKIEKNYELLEEIVPLFFDSVKKSNSFRVSCQRVDKSFPYKSIEVERRIGEIIFENTGVQVKLKLPELNFEIEIGEDGIYIFTERVRGYGGMPYGSAGKLGVLFSGGIDSPVAAFLMMKRGVEPVLIHYKITDQEVDKVKLLRNKLEEYSAGKSIKLIIIDRNELFKGKFSEIYNNKKLQPFVCVMCKFLMHSRAAKVAEEENLLGIITGDNLAQVATQTLKNLFAYRTASKLPVYSPLISFDKIDTIEIARDIGTYEISIQKAEACIPPKNPKTGVVPQMFKNILEEVGLSDE